MVYRRKKTHYGDTHLKRRWMTKRRTRDLDQIDEDIRPENSEKLQNQEVDFDKPGAAQHYCVHCARYFINITALQDHFRTKVHKRRLKALELEPYSIEDSERAAGQGSWRAPVKRKIETQQEVDKVEPEESSKKMKINDDLNFVRRYTSALYITGEKAQKNFAVLTPVVDFDEKLINKDSLRNNIAKRGLGIDIEQIEKKWTFFKSIEERKQHLETTRTEISVAISNLLKISDSKRDDIERLKLHARVVKDDLKNLKDAFYGIEEDTMLKILSLPNDLHEKTPEKESVIYSSPNSNINGKSSKNHIEIAKSNDYIQYFNPSTYYLKSNAALFEISILNYFRQCLLKSGHVQFSNPSFCRSIIVEGCGNSSGETSDVFTLEEESSSKNEINRLHLCGSSNLYPFMAYFTRHALQQSSLPLKYFSVGKKYTPVLTDSSASLFNLSQEAVLNTFIAVSEEDDILDSIFEEVSKIYEPLGYHYRLTLLPANKLEKSESLRLSIQMYSNYLQSYVEVGNVSLYENYMSKRLLFTYNSNKGKRYPKVVSGTLLNVPKMLGCILENNSISNNALLSDLLKSHMGI